MKTKHILGMMAGAWMLASCSNQDEQLQLEEVATVIGVDYYVGGIAGGNNGGTITACY